MTDSEERYRLLREQIKNTLSMLRDNEAECEACGKSSTWAEIRRLDGKSALCYSCEDAKITTNEVTCVCDSKDLFHFGCRCNYSKRRKKDV
jgi:hypothetical protein